MPGCGLVRLSSQALLFLHTPMEDSCVLAGSFGGACSRSIAGAPRGFCKLLHAESACVYDVVGKACTAVAPGRRAKSEDTEVAVAGTWFELRLE